jgi:hypothetical protein
MLIHSDDPNKFKEEQLLSPGKINILLIGHQKHDRYISRGITQGQEKS